MLKCEYNVPKNKLPFRITETDESALSKNKRVHPEHWNVISQTRIINHKYAELTPVESALDCCCEAGG